VVTQQFPQTSHGRRISCLDPGAVVVETASVLPVWLFPDTCAATSAAFTSLVATRLVDPSSRRTAPWPASGSSRVSGWFTTVTAQEAIGASGASRFSANVSRVLG
jgi:hypothetical protein